MFDHYTRVSIGAAAGAFDSSSSRESLVVFQMIWEATDRIFSRTLCAVFVGRGKLIRLIRAKVMTELEPSNIKERRREIRGKTAAVVMMVKCRSKRDETGTYI